MVLEWVLSTTLAIYDMQENILENLEKDFITCTIFCDLSKAFDTTDHDVLLWKSNNFFGIRGLPLKLLASYLQGRQQYTVIDGCTSATLNITQEVPQGSSLGPLLFALHINDLPSTTKLTPTLSADATILSISGINSTELQNIVNTELGKVNEWLDFNQLSLNYSKTSHTIVSHKNNQHIDFNSTPFGVLFYWCFSCLIFLCIFFYQFTIYDLVFLFCCLFVYFCDLVFPLLLVFFCFVVTARLSQYSHISLLVNKEI